MQEFWIQLISLAYPEPRLPLDFSVLKLCVLLVIIGPVLLDAGIGVDSSGTFLL